MRKGPGNVKQGVIKALIYESAQMGVIYKDAQRLKAKENGFIHILYFVPKVPTIFRGNTGENSWNRGDN
jgi:hypothetical protein